jgi:hypothetical protein
VLHFLTVSGMTKGKYKRKKQKAQQQAQERAAAAIVVEQKKMPENEAKPAAESAKKPSHNKNPSHWQRFKEYAKRNTSFTDWCIAAFTLVLATAAIYQFIIMRGQLDQMRKEQRAWLTVEQKSSGTTLALNGAASTSVILKNTGKTPGKRIIGNFFLEIVRNGDSPHFEGDVMHTVSVMGSFSPDTSQDVAVVRRRHKRGGGPNDAEDDPFTSEEMTALQDGKAWIAVHGIVGYDDVFSRHWTKFCVWSDAKPGDYLSRSCTMYNDTDDD